MHKLCKIIAHLFKFLSLSTYDNVYITHFNVPMNVELREY